MILLSSRRTPSSAASEFGEQQRDDFTSPLQRLFGDDKRQKKVKPKQTKNDSEKQK